MVVRLKCHLMLEIRALDETNQQEIQFLFSLQVIIIDKT